MLIDFIHGYKFKDHEKAVVFVNINYIFYFMI